jgi:hypothetical protein
MMWFSQSVLNIKRGYLERKVEIQGWAKKNDCGRLWLKRKRERDEWQWQKRSKRWSDVFWVNMSLNLKKWEISEECGKSGRSDVRKMMRKETCMKTFRGDRLGDQAVETEGESWLIEQLNEGTKNQIRFVK